MQPEKQHKINYVHFRIFIVQVHVRAVGRLAWLQDSIPVQSRPHQRRDGGARLGAVYRLGRELV